MKPEEPQWVEGTWQRVKTSAPCKEDRERIRQVKESEKAVELSSCGAWWDRKLLFLNLEFLSFYRTVDSLAKDHHFLTQILYSEMSQSNHKRILG